MVPLRKIQYKLQYIHCIIIVVCCFCLQVAEIQKKMSEVKNLLDESCQLAERLVGEKLSKPKYMEQEKNVSSRIDRVMGEVNTIVQTL